MPLTPSTRITGQEDGMIAACLIGRRDVVAHTLRLADTIEYVRLMLPSRPILLELLEAYRDAVGERHRAIAEVCAALHVTGGAP